MLFFLRFIPQEVFQWLQSRLRGVVPGRVLLPVVVVVWHTRSSPRQGPPRPSPPPLPAADPHSMRSISIMPSKYRFRILFIPLPFLLKTTLVSVCGKSVSLYKKMPERQHNFAK